MSSFTKNIQLARNMGLRYVAFRTGFELQKKLGLFKKKFPQDPPLKKFITLAEWRKKSRFWGITRHDKNDLGLSSLPEVERLFRGEIPFFSAQWINLGTDYDWMTNPDTGYHYDPAQHWSEVQDYSQEAGDIKFVWEKSRFAYLYEVMRYDFLKGEDHAEWVFNEIGSWLKMNKINSGPNYTSSQEISLRVLNWTYALNFYKDSVFLTEGLFEEIINAIYRQLQHVYANINFSRIAVRNNHAITETLTLYLGALFYPYFPEAQTWKEAGKKWFEQEIAYQVYPDGTFLQFSMNYHRVVIQLLTWALKTGDFFGERFADVVYDRAYKSLQFLFSCQDEYTGRLPNYGSNDGALFFRFNSCDYRDYRPQLNVLHVLLTGKSLYGTGAWEEDAVWFRAQQLQGCSFPVLNRREGWSLFETSGYYILREMDTLTFIRCGNHKDRPAQADNLHLDIWYKGENVLFDGGSYKYNTDPEILRYFMGTASHNTVMLDGHDQMLKGARFIWYHWTQSLGAHTGENEEAYTFEGTISAFQALKPGTRHTRKIRKQKGRPVWVVEDTVPGKAESVTLKQYWHKLPDVKISSKDKRGGQILLQKGTGMRSDYYGIKADADQYIAETTEDTIITTIEIT